MKKFAVLINILYLSITLSAQIENPSFEINGSPSLDDWTAVCMLAESVNEAAPNSGDWSLKLQTGNTQGCIYADFYQIIPNITSGDYLSLSSWVKSPGTTTPSINIGVIDTNNQITILASTTSDNTEWEVVTVGTEVLLEATEQAVIVLNAGLTSGPVGGAEYYGLYDGLTLSTTLSSEAILSPNTVQWFPNPIVSEFINLHTTLPYEDFIGISLYNNLGQRIQFHTSYQKTLYLKNLTPGFYFIETSTKKGSIVKTIIVI